MSQPTAVGIYCRISDDRTGERAGVKRQQEDCEQLAGKRGWSVGRVYVDNDLTAYQSSKRPEYRRMLDDIRAGTIDGIIVWHQDRLHRQPKELEEFFEVCDEAGLTHMATVSGDIDLSDDDGRFRARIMGAVARKESDDKSRRIKRKHLELARQGKGKGGGTRPFGFNKDRLTLREKEAVLVREAAERVLSGASLRSICADWKRRGIKTVTGAEWSTTVLKRILVAPRTAGLREHLGEVVRTDGGDRVKAEWEAVFDVKTHERLKAVLGDPNRNKFNGIEARKYLLTGFLYCELCDAKLVARPKGDGRRCYVCASGVNFKGCGKIRQLAGPLEKMVAEAVYAQLGSVETPLPKGANDEQDVEIEALVRSIGEDEAKLVELAGDYYEEASITKGQFLALTHRVQNRIEETRREIARLQRQPEVNWTELLAKAAAAHPVWDLERRDGYGKHFDIRDFEWWRAVIGATVQKVVVGPAVRGQNFFNPDRVQIVWR